MPAVLRSVFEKAIRVNGMFPLYIHIPHLRVFIDDCRLYHVISVFLPQLIDRRIQPSLLLVLFQTSEQIELLRPETEVGNRHAEASHKIMPRINFPKECKSFFADLQGVRAWARKFALFLISAQI